MTADDGSGPPRYDDLAGDDATDEAGPIRAGLERPLATIEPKYFYDPLGARLFDAITQLPEYPLARVEAALVAAHRDPIASAMREAAARAGGPVELVDLGAGDCGKARTWIAAIRPARYTAVDFSIDGLAAAFDRLRTDYPWLALSGVRNDFTLRLRLPEPGAPSHRAARIALFPGSSIGNFSPPAARRFLGQVRDACPAGLLIGFDLVKPAARLQLAYDDPLGVTAAFNRNVLRHVNRLLGSDFDIRDWAHRAHYDEPNQRVRMHLEALHPVEVRWPGGGRRFARGERIHTEDSYKWTPEGLRELLAAAGYGRQQAWTDDDWGFAVAWAGA